MFIGLGLLGTAVGGWKTFSRDQKNRLEYLVGIGLKVWVVSLWVLMTFAMNWLTPGKLAVIWLPLLFGIAALLKGKILQSATVVTR